MVVLNSEILRDVGSLARCIQSMSDIKYREIKLQRGQFVFLTRVCEQPGINLIELSSLLRVDKATTTKAIQKLVQEDYVWRERDGEDKRIWHVFPTEKARKIYAYIIEEENRNIESCLQGFQPEERCIAGQLLRRMSENIEQEWKKQKVQGAKP